MASPIDTAAMWSVGEPEAEAPLDATATATTTTTTMEYTDAAATIKSETIDVPQDTSAPEDMEEQEGAGPVEGEAADESKKWPGWPGYSVFRMVVPVSKVGSIIGRKGELVKKLCEETRARVRILEGPIGTTDRIVLVSGKEEPDAEISPAMHAVVKVFKRIIGISDGEGNSAETSGQPGSVRLLVASPQAFSLIGKGGSLIKSIQEGSGATVRVLSGDEFLYAAHDERVVDIQGESLKVVKALEIVVGQLRKFLVDHSVIPLFIKNGSASMIPMVQGNGVDSWADKTQSSLHATSHTKITSDQQPPLQEPSYFDHESRFDSHIQHSSLSLYGQDPALTPYRSYGLGHSAGALVTQITQSMQIPLLYAEDIIGIGGANIAYIRRTSGAILTVQESRDFSDEIAVEIKGTSTQVQTAQKLIQEFIAGHEEPGGRSYGNLDSGFMSSYSRLGNTSFPSSPSSLPYQYGSSGALGGYGRYRY